VLKSILKLVRRGTLWLAWLSSESCLLSSGTAKDLGLDGSEDNMLAVCFCDGSKILTSGLVINPNTCMDPTVYCISLVFETNL